VFLFIQARASWRLNILFPPLLSSLLQPSCSFVFVIFFLFFVDNTRVADYLVTTGLADWFVPFLICLNQTTKLPSFLFAAWCIYFTLLSLLFCFFRLPPSAFKMAGNQLFSFSFLPVFVPLCIKCLKQTHVFEGSSISSHILLAILAE